MTHVHYDAEKWTTCADCRDTLRRSNGRVVGPLRLYVAASSQERARYRHAVRGLDLTHDWEAHFDRHDAALAEGDVAEADRLFGESMLMCLRGVVECDLFVMLVPTTPTRGAWFEAGVARGLGRPMISIGDASRLDIWGPCFDAHYESMAEVLEHLEIVRRS